ncbi:FAD-dependent oxidoreductase, partial [bacterium]|nr:FAD-dependent oxidoreductase [bacterium]
LVHDRPVLGGNASSEIRMSVGGAHGKNNRESGLIEEIECESFHRNPMRNWSIWDSILYEKVRFEPNITMLLNCSCNDAEMDGNRIVSVRAWQGTAETWHTVKAKIFADCSGDSILAPLTGAEFRTGREARAEFNEDIEPEETDDLTMGMSCLIEAREMPGPIAFIPPKWANIYETCDDLPNRRHGIQESNYWWIELGGMDDTIHDTERLRDELLKAAFGVWDHVKNRGDHGADNWALDWIGFLPGKRESRRYVGDHIITQNDVRSEGRFEDLVAYGGWSMDDHHPGGLRYPGKPTIFHPAPSPWGIPFRSLYSKNIENLMFAGRNLSATHAAMSSSRVMRTCAVIGQGMGTGAVVALKNGLAPRQVYEQKMDEIKQTLMDDDCYLPFNRRRVPEMTAQAQASASDGDVEMLRNGYDRPVGDEENCCVAAKGAWAEYRFDAPRKISQIRMVFDTDLSRSPNEYNMKPWFPLDMAPKKIAEVLVKGYRVEAEVDGKWETVHCDEGNYQRFVRVAVDVRAAAVRLIPEETWGAELCRVFSFDVR